jgi:hypothetical protein
MVLNTRVKRALSRKQVGVTPVSNTGIKPRVAVRSPFGDQRSRS